MTWRAIVLSCWLPLLLAACGGGGGDGPRVLAAPQSLSFGAAQGLRVGGSGQVQATASSGLPALYSSRSPAVCDVDAASGLVHGLQAGSCTIVASQSGNADWAVAPPQSIALVVLGQLQTLLWRDTPALQAGSSAALAAAASSGLAVGFTSLTPATCTVDAVSGLVSGLAAGACSVAAEQAGDAQWAAAPRSLLSIAVQARPQTTAFDSAPAALAVDAAAVLHATAASGLPVVYSSLTPTVCTVSADGGRVLGLAAGLCSIAADQAGDGAWAAAATAQQTLSVSTTLQSLTFGAAPRLTVGSSQPVQARASSGLPAGLRSLTPEVCAVDTGGTLVSGLAAGTCRLLATQPGDRVWAAAEPATLALAVAQQPQFISFGAAPGLTVTATARVAASATSGLALTYASLTPATCSIDPHTAVVTGVAVGNCTIAANQPGDGVWAPAMQATLALLVDFRSQRISLGAAPSLVSGRSATLSASASSGLALSFSSLTPAVCSVQADSGLVRGLAEGNCSVAIDQPGNASWGIAPQALVSLTVAMDPAQSIRFGALPSLVVGGTASVVASASSGLPVRFGSLTPAVCQIDAVSGIVAGLANGQCVVGASQAGDARWEAATPVTQSFPVAVRTQLISFGPAPALTVTQSAAVRASTTAALPIAYSSLSATVCSVQAETGLVTALAAGTCTIAANQPGDTSWASALQATQSFYIDFLAQHISFGAAPALTANSSATLHATASSGLPVVFSSLSAGVCSVQSDAGVVTGLSAGLCTVAANQPGNTTWAAATAVTQGFAVAQGSQAITFGAAPALAVTGEAVVTALATSGLPVVYSSLSPEVCTVDSGSGLVRGLAVGSCNLTANQSGNASWAAAATSNLRIAVALMTQTISFSAAPALTAGGSARVSASANSNLAVGYTSVTPSVCAINASSGVVTALVAGNCTVRASQAGNSAWAAAADVTQNLTVSFAIQSIGFSSLPSSLVAGSTVAVRASASSALPVSLSSLSPTVCSVDSSSALVTGLVAGSCSVAANQAGDAIWAPAAQVAVSFAVSNNPVQTLSFATAPRLTLGGSASVSATASSGLPVSYSSLSPGVCSVNASSGLVTDLSLGECIIAANQAGNGNYNPAAQLSQTLAVQVPTGVTVPTAPTGVAAKLGNNTSTVIVSVGGVGSGGNAITGYTVVSSPAGITASASSAPLTVSCPSGCAGFAFSVYASNGVGNGAASSPVPVLTVFDVRTTFHEPDTQPRESVFTGSFTLNSTTGAISNLSGTLTESMSGSAAGSAPYYDMTQVRLTYQLQTWRDAGLGGSFVASFANTTTNTFTTMAGGDGWSPASGVANGGIYAGFEARPRRNAQNSYVLLFVPDNPFAALLPAQLDKLAYADCAPGGMMGAVCMTATSVAGYGAIGTMSGYPLSQVLVRR